MRYIWYINLEEPVQQKGTSNWGTIAYNEAYLYFQCLGMDNLVHPILNVARDFFIHVLTSMAS